MNLPVLVLIPYKNNKTGKKYMFVGVSTDQTNNSDSTEEYVIYFRGNNLYHRKRSEFEKKFTKIK